MNGRVTSDGKGFTVDKSLAWTIGAALLGGGVWLGSEVIGTKNAVIDIREAQIRDEADITQYRRDTDMRIRTLETSRAGDDQRLTNALNLLTRIDQRLERLEQRISP